MRQILKSFVFFTLVFGLAYLNFVKVPELECKMFWGYFADYNVLTGCKAPVPKNLNSQVFHLASYEH